MQFVAKFFDGKNSSGHYCELVCENGLVSFTYNGDFLNLQNITWHKTSSKLLINSDSLGKHSYICVEKPEYQLELLEFLKTIKKPKKIWFSKSFLIYYGIIGALCATWVFLDSLVFLLPNSIEPWLEKQARLIHFRNNAKLFDDTNNPTLKKIKDAFEAADPDLEGISIEVIKSDELNAITLPNKKVLVYSKLISKASSIEEVVGVLAHEMGHVKNRHCIGTYLKLTFLGMIDKLIAGGSLSESGILMYFLSFSRQSERQADDCAIQYLEKLKLSTKGLAQFFKKIDKKQSSKFWDSEFFSTHPRSADRTRLFASEKKSYKNSVFGVNDLVYLKCDICSKIPKNIASRKSKRKNKSKNSPML